MIQAVVVADACHVDCYVQVVVVADVRTYVMLIVTGRSCSGCMSC